MKIEKCLTKEIPKESKHIRFNCEMSEDSLRMEHPYTRYYFAIVDKRHSYRKETQNKIINLMAEVNSGIIPIIDDVEMKVKESDWGLLYFVYDAMVDPKSLNLGKLNIPVKRDYKMAKKQVLNIEDHLRTIYE
jgi:hypothetical protein